MSDMYLILHIRLVISDYRQVFDSLQHHSNVSTCIDIYAEENLINTWPVIEFQTCGWGYT